MSSEETPPMPRASRRVAIDAEVRLEFERFTGFLEEMAANLSEGGMFVRTRNLRPVGSRLRFEIALSDQWPLVRGTGEVVWTRWRDGGAQEPAGMGIRFEQLDSQSRDLIGRVVAERRRSGWSPFDLDAAAPAADEDSEPENWFDLASRRDTEDLVEVAPRAVEPSPAGEAPWTGEWGAGAPVSDVAPAPPASTSSPVPVAPAVVATSFELGPLFPPDELTAPATASPAPDEPAAPVSSSPPAAPWFEPPPSLTDEPPARTGSSVTGRDPEPGMSEFRTWLGPPAAADSLPVAAAPAREEPSWVRTGEPSPGRPSRWRAAALALLAVAALAGLGAWLARRSVSTSAVAGEGSGRADAVAAAVAPAAALPAAPPATAAAGQPPSAPASEPAAAARFTALERITWEQQPGGTLVTLWFDGEIPEEAVRQSRLESGGARELLQIRGARRPFPQPRLEVGNAQLVRIRTGFHSGDEQHVVLDLAGLTVRLLDLEVAGNQIRFRLGTG